MKFRPLDRRHENHFNGVTGIQFITARFDSLLLNNYIYIYNLSGDFSSAVRRARTGHNFLFITQLYTIRDGGSQLWRSY